MKMLTFILFVIGLITINANVINDKIIDENVIENNHDESMSLNDQVQLLSKQLNALMTRRREDYKLLENNMKKFVRKNALEFSDIDIQSELDQLRKEVKALREGTSTNKERLTVQWLSQSISELRTELAELQETSSNASKDVQQRNQIMDDISGLKNDLKTLRLELEALKSRQQSTEVLVSELRAEAVQSAEDLRRSLLLNNKNAALPNTIDYIEPEVDHRMRHHRFTRQQIRDLEVSQRSMQRKLSELQTHHIDDRLHSLEMEQRRLANANFNLSRQIASLDKLHSSMLELLEDFEGIQNKVDKTIPDIKREISKLEFSSAQVTSEQNLLREEGHNAGKSIQAIAVSVSALQEDRDILRAVQKQMETLENDITKMKSASNVHKDVFHSRIEKIEMESKLNLSENQHHQQTGQERQQQIDGESLNGLSPDQQAASLLVEQLESIELEYETIVNKLPHDCSQIGQNANGYYLIAPEGQQHPIMTRCDNGWTIIQRRHDGSIDFNRSWEQYAQGFGTPAGEYWIGNEPLHHLTKDNCTQLKIIMQDIYDNTWYAEYDNFKINSRDDGYRLTISGYKGNASDALDYQNRMQFSSIDVDKDISNTHCAANYEGGWWFSHCQHANLNGRYNLGLTWFDSSRNEWIAVKSSQMMISRMANCRTTTTETETMDANKQEKVSYTTISASSSPSLVATTKTTTALGTSSV